MQVVLTLHDTMLTETYGYWNHVIVLHGSLVTEIVAMELCRKHVSDMHTIELVWQ